MGRCRSDDHFHLHRNFHRLQLLPCGLRRGLRAQRRLRAAPSQRSQKLVLPQRAQSMVPRRDRPRQGTAPGRPARHGAHQAPASREDSRLRHALAQGRQHSPAQGQATRRPRRVPVLQPHLQAAGRAYGKPTPRLRRGGDAVTGVAIDAKYDDVLLPFARLMAKELHANAGKGDRPGWLMMTPAIGMLEIYYHAAKLQKAIKDGNGEGIREYAADVANMAMMLLDVCGGLGAGRPVMVGFGRELPVLHGGTRQGDIGLGRQQATAGGCPVSVAGIVVPAQRARPRVDRPVADFILVVDQLQRAVAGNEVDLVAADAQADPYAIGFADRYAKVAGEAFGAGAVVGEILVAVVGLRVVDAVADADAVVGQIGVVIIGPEAGLVGAARAADGEAVTAAEQVVLAQRSVEDDAGVLRIADAELHAARGLLLDLDRDVHLVLAARHQFLVDVHLLEITQPLQADLGAVDRRLRIHRTLELAHFPAQHVVLGLGVAGEYHAAYIHALARFDVHGQVDQIGRAHV